MIHLVMGAIVIFAVGLVAGFLAYALLPARQNVVVTTGLTVSGAAVGGAISALLADGPWWALRGSGVVLATVGALAVLLLITFGQRARA